MGLLVYFNTRLVQYLGHINIFYVLATIVLKNFGHLPISQKVKGALKFNFQILPLDMLKIIID